MILGAAEGGDLSSDHSVEAEVPALYSEVVCPRVCSGVKIAAGPPTWGLSHPRSRSPQPLGAVPPSRSTNALWKDDSDLCLRQEAGQQVTAETLLGDIDREGAGSWWMKEEVPTDRGSLYQGISDLSWSVDPGETAACPLLAHF